MVVRSRSPRNQACCRSCYLPVLETGLLPPQASDGHFGRRRLEGYARLRERHIELVAAESPGSFQDDGPTARLVRQVLGAVAEFDKAMTVSA